MLNEHSVAIVSFEGAIKREARRIKEALARVDTLSAFKFQVSVAGPVHSGQAKIVFSLADNEYGSNTVSGDSLNAVLDEFLRRHGWEKAHAPLQIGFSMDPDTKGGADTAEEIPF